MRLVFALISVLVASVAGAQPMPWMKKTNPNELVTEVLFLGATGEACPSQAQVTETVHGVLVRSRIKPTNLGSTRTGVRPSLLVANSLCDDEIFVVSIEFIGSREDGYAYRFGASGYGVVGRASRPETVLDAIERGVEAAITDYLKANFDL